MKGKKESEANTVSHRFYVAGCNWRRGKLGIAARELRNLEKDLPENMRVKLALAGVLKESKRFEEAARVLKKATKLNRTFFGASLGLFHTLLALGKVREALRESKRFQKLRPSRHYMQVTADIRSLSRDSVDMVALYKMLDKKFKPNPWRNFKKAKPV